MDEYYVYKLIDPRNNQPFYVGKGSKLRWKHHLTETKENTQNIRKFYKIQKILREGYEIGVEFHTENIQDEQEAYDIETMLIEKYGRKGYEESGILTNICVDNRPPDGTGRKRKPLSDKQKQNISDGCKGKNKGRILGAPSEEHRRRNSESHKGKIPWNKGKTLSEKHIQNLSDSHKGYKVLEETKQKISNALKGRKREAFSNEHRKNMSKVRKGKPWSEARRVAQEKKNEK